MSWEDDVAAQVVEALSGGMFDAFENWETYAEACKRFGVKPKELLDERG